MVIIFFYVYEGNKDTILLVKLNNEKQGSDQAQ